MVQE
jgi:hypothetical protein